MSITTVFWLVFAALFAWFFIADVIGARRYAYQLLLIRSVGSLLFSLCCVLELLDRSSAVATVALALGLFWIAWFSRKSDFRQGLKQRGITDLDLLRFKKP
jgi:hypothetical protein